MPTKSLHVGMCLILVNIESNWPLFEANKLPYIKRSPLENNIQPIFCVMLCQGPKHLLMDSTFKLKIGPKL